MCTGLAQVSELLLRTTALLGLALGLVVGPAAPASAKAAPSRGDSVFDAIDKTLPGYGRDVANTQHFLVHDMALGWYVVAAVQRRDIDQAKVAADQLLAIRHKGGPAVPGWGLGWAWDAFGDGSVNPAHTVYGITTAIVARGLFDLYDVTGAARYRDAAVDALEYYYERSFVRSTNALGGVGVFWYSNTAYDRSWRVFNVISMLMGQYARAFAQTGNEIWKDVATRCFRYMWTHRKTTPLGLRWDYQFNGSVYRKANDGVHAAFVVQGMIDYEKYLPDLYDIAPAVNYLAAYNPVNQPLWSIAQLMFTLTEAGKPARAEQLRDMLLPAYRVVGFRYGNTPKDKNVYVRQMTQLAAGLLRVEAAGAA